MNLILLDDEDFVRADAVRLEGPRARHVRKVLRARVGDTVRVGRVGGALGRGSVLAVTREGVELRVTLDAPPPEPSPHRLVLALPRPPALRRILRSTAAMGIKRIALIDTARVERSFWQSSQVEPARIREQLRLGLEQGRDTILPEVTLARRFEGFVDRELPEWLRGARGLIGHPESAAPCPHALDAAACVLVGPEGGFLDPEIAALRERGAEPVSLGGRPLAIDTAVIALLARISA